MLLVAARLITRHAHPRVIRVLERYLHSLQQLRRPGAVVRVDTDAGIQSQLQCHAGKMKAASEGARELIDIDPRALDGETRRDHEEPALSEACQHMLAGNISTQAPPRFPHHLVTDILSKRRADLPHAAHENEYEGERLQAFST